MKAWMYLVICAVLSAGTAITVFGVAGPGEREEEDGFGLFSWSGEMMEETERERLYTCLGRAGVTEVYQKFSEESLKEDKSRAFVKGMREKGVGVYALMGEPEWAYERDGKRLIREIEYIAKYNEGHGEEERILGVMVDVEPYLLDEWDEGSESRKELMEGFLSGMKQAYAYAGHKQLKFWACIPMFYDSDNEDILEGLIAGGCDGVAVMNYSRRDEYGQMAKEVGYAREYGKDIICIYELQKPGRHELKDINTYANEGMEALQQSVHRLESQFGYERLKFAYHHYGALKEFLGLEGQ